MITEERNINNEIVSNEINVVSRSISGPELFFSQLVGSNGNPLFCHTDVDLAKRFELKTAEEKYSNGLIKDTLYLQNDVPEVLAISSGYDPEYMRLEYISQNKMMNLFRFKNSAIFSVSVIEMANVIDSIFVTKKSVEEISRLLIENNFGVSRKRAIAAKIEADSIGVSYSCDTEINRKYEVYYSGNLVMYILIQYGVIPFNDRDVVTIMYVDREVVERLDIISTNRTGYRIRSDTSNYYSQELDGVIPFKLTDRLFSGVQNYEAG